MKRDFLVVEFNGTLIAGVLKGSLSKTEAEAWAETVNSIEQIINPDFSAAPMSAAEYAQRQSDTPSPASPSRTHRRKPVLHG